MKTPKNVLTEASLEAQSLYRNLLAGLRAFGPFKEEIKATSVHLVRKSAFAGVRFRKTYLNLTIKSEQPLASARCLKSERVSKNRWHNELKLSNDAELDREFLFWCRTAYDLCG